MATFGPSFIASFKTDADLSQSQYHIIKVSAPGNVVLATAKTDVMMGVLTDGVADGTGRSAGVSVAITGIAKIKSGEAIPVGAPLTSDGSGRATHSTVVTGDHMVGRALTSAGGPDEIIEVLLAPGTIY